MNVRPNTTRCGFTLTEFLFVVVALSVLVALYLPSLTRHHGCSGGISCVNNLKQVGLAFRQWALDNNDKFPMQVSATNGGTMEFVGSGNVYVHFLVMSNELNTPKVLFCPQESRPLRQPAVTFDAATALGAGQIPFTNDLSATYFVGVDAVDTSRQMFLAGDDNLTIRGLRVKRGLHSLWTNTPIAWTKDRHVNQGNICLADGSVQGLNSQALTRAFQSTGVITNRLAMP